MCAGQITEGDKHCGNLYFEYSHLLKPGRRDSVVPSVSSFLKRSKCTRSDPASSILSTHISSDVILNLLFFFFLFCHSAWYVEPPQPGMKSMPSAVEAQSLNHGPSWKTSICIEKIFETVTNRGE